LEAILGIGIRKFELWKDSHGRRIQPTGGS